MKNKDVYPLTYAFISNRPDETMRIFKKVSPHKGAFIGVSPLETDISSEEPKSVFESLEVGEILEISPADPTKLNVTPLEVKRKDGTSLGNLPFHISAIPTVLMSRGLKPFCFLEAKQERSGLFFLAVSVYSEQY